MRGVRANRSVRLLGDIVRLPKVSPENAFFGRALNGILLRAAHHEIGEFLRVRAIYLHLSDRGGGYRLITAHEKTAIWYVYAVKRMAPGDTSREASNTICSVSIAAAPYR